MKIAYLETWRQIIRVRGNLVPRVSSKGEEEERDPGNEVGYEEIIEGESLLNGEIA